MNKTAASPSGADSGLEVTNKPLRKTTLPKSVHSQPQTASASTQHAALNKNPKIIGPYQVGEEIGRGAYGKVYKGLNFQTGQLVAIKHIKIKNFREEKRQQLQSEINLLKRLEHPNIVKYIDSIYTAEHHYLNIILEYVENGSLDCLIRKFGKFPEDLVAIYVLQVLQGLDYLHNQGVIHRDIKGGNILTTKDGVVKLADFGVATKLSDSENHNSVVGTPFWMAPEVIEMSGQVTSACDIWSLGCTVIELLTTKPPYIDQHPCAAMIKIVQEDMPPLPEGISPELKDFLAKCFEKDPFKRIDAKNLLRHPWLSKPNNSLYSKILLLADQQQQKPQKLAEEKAEQKALEDPLPTAQSSQMLLESVGNTIKLHISQQKSKRTSQNSSEPSSGIQSMSSSVRHQSPKSSGLDHQPYYNNSRPQGGLRQGKALNNGEGGDEDVGDIGDEIVRNDDVSEVPIEKPKCISSFNVTGGVGGITQNPFSPVSISQALSQLQNPGFMPQIYQGQPAPLQSSSHPQSKHKAISNSKSSGGMIPSIHSQVQLPLGGQQRPSTSISQTQPSTKTATQSQSTDLGSKSLMMRQSLAQNAAMIQLQQQSKQVFDVQGNRKSHYLTKKNHVSKDRFNRQQEEDQHPNEEFLNTTQRHEETLNQSNSSSNRQKRIDSGQPFDQQAFIIDAEQQELQQQQAYQKQQREIAARYHQAAMNNPPLSTGMVLGNQHNGHSIAGILHPKAKSNDLMILGQKPMVRQQTPQYQIIIPNAQNSQQIIANQVVGPVFLQQSYQSAKNHFDQAVQDQHQQRSSPTSRSHFQFPDPILTQAHLMYPLSTKNEILYPPPSSSSHQASQGYPNQSFGARILRQQQLQQSYMNQNQPLQADPQGIIDLNSLNQFIHQSRQAPFTHHVAPNQFHSADTSGMMMLSGGQHGMFKHPGGATAGVSGHHQRFGSSKQVKGGGDQSGKSVERKRMSHQYMGNSSNNQRDELVQASFQFQTDPLNPDRMGKQPQIIGNSQHKDNNAVDPGNLVSISPRNFGDGKPQITSVVQPQINMQELANVRDSFLKRQLNQTEDGEEGDLSEKSAGFENNKLGLMMMMASLGGKEEPNINAHQEGLSNQLISNRSEEFGSEKRMVPAGDSLIAQQALEESNLLVTTVKNCLGTIFDIRRGKALISAGTNLQVTETEESVEQKNDRNDIEDHQLTLMNSIRKMLQILHDFGSDQLKDHIMRTLGYTALIRLLAFDEEDIVSPVLQLINTICESSARHQEMMCLFGIVPFLQKFSQAHNPREITVEVAYFIGQVFKESNIALQMFLSNQGMKILVDFLSFDFLENKDLIMLSIESSLVILSEFQNQLVPQNIPLEDLVLMLISFGLPQSIIRLLPSIIYSIETSTVLNEHSQSEKFLEKAFDVLQCLLQVNSTEVSLAFCEAEVMKDGLVRIIQGTINEATPITLSLIRRFTKLLQAITQTPAVYQILENQEVVKLLVELLHFFMADHNQLQLQMIYDTLKLINNLCKLSPARTEQAAMASVLAPIKDLVIQLQSRHDISRSKKGKLLKYVLSIVQEFVSSSPVTRQLLNGYQIQQVLLSVIQQNLVVIAGQGTHNSSTSKDQLINGKVLDLYVLWVQTESSQIEAFLAKRATLETFFNIFLQTPRTKIFLYVFSALNRMVSLSTAIAKAIVGLPHLLEKLANSLGNLEMQLTQSLAQDKPGLDREEGPQNQRNSQQAQIMKELMEIFMHLIQRGGGVANLQGNLPRTFYKVYQTAEAHNLVILQSIAQSILNHYGMSSSQQLPQSKKPAQLHHRSGVSNLQPPPSQQMFNHTSHNNHSVFVHPGAIRAKSPNNQ